MFKIFNNKYFAGALVFAAFQWLAYSVFTGTHLTDRTRGSVKGIDSLIFWLSDKIGAMPAAIVLSLLGVALGFYAYKRMERLTAS